MMPPGGFGADDYWGCLGLGPADDTDKSLTSLTDFSVAKKTRSSGLGRRSVYQLPAHS